MVRSVIRLRELLHFRDSDHKILRDPLLQKAILNSELPYDIICYERCSDDVVDSHTIYRYIRVFSDRLYLESAWQRSLY